MSVSIIYVMGKKVLALTRGDGEYGNDITEFTNYVKGIPDRIPLDDKVVELRGELYVNKETFKEKFAGKFANPRNFVGGAIALTSPSKILKKEIECIIYDMIRNPFTTELVKHNYINQMSGIQSILQFSAHASGSFETMKEQMKEYMNDLANDNLPLSYEDKLPFAIDGIVVKLNDIPLAESINEEGNPLLPKAWRAIKYPTEQATTRLYAIEWNTGKTGRVTPTGLINPVHLCGTTVSRVTLFNKRFIEEHNIGLQSEIVVEKSGDIIPHFIRVVKAGRPVEIPKLCTSCGSELSEDSVNLSCCNRLCVAQISKSAESFLKGIHILNVGYKTIDKLPKPIEKLRDLFTVDMDSWKLAAGNKNGEKIYNSIQSMPTVSLGDFFTALNLGGIGTMAAKLISYNGCKSIEDVLSLTSEDIYNTPGFGAKKMTAFVSAIVSLEDEIKLIAKHVQIPEYSVGKLDGRAFCFTGSFKNPTRKEMEEIVKVNGGKILSSVTSSMTALVWDGKISGKKLSKAREKGQAVISQKDFLEIVGG